MLRAAGAIYVPKCLAREVFHLAVVGRGFKSDSHKVKITKFLHSGLIVGAGTGAAVLALSGVEIVADREFNFLGIHQVCLHDGMAAEIGIDIEMCSTCKVLSFKA